MLLLLVSMLLGQVREGTLDSENIVKARAQGGEQRFEWLEWSPESFAKAKREHKVVLVDCAAEWCHWCHVMDETTYRDPQVGAWLAQHAVAIRVDIDARPDLADRYGEWGWPATILLSGDAQELGKFRGYLPPERMLGLLEQLDASKPLEGKREPAGVSVREVPKAMAHALARLDFFYDAKEGSWGLRRKVPIGMNVQWELARGTKASLARADFTLSQQRVLIDPVWGGLSQYSGGGDWKDPHFEKLAKYQAANLEAYARGYLRTKKQQHLDDARAIAGYLRLMLRSPDGDFYVNQDADLNAHERSKPFVDGHVYYALDDEKRRALGVPWVDTHVYAAENGRVMAAFVALFEAKGEGLDDARVVAERLAVTHVLADGSVKHEATSSAKGPFFLEDAAALGLGFAALARVTREPKYEELSRRIAGRMVANFGDANGLLFDSTADGDAVGVFSRRGHSFGANVVAARLLAAVGEKSRGQQLVAALSGTQRLDDEWAWLGEYLLAATELGFTAR